MYIWKLCLVVRMYLAKDGTGMYRTVRMYLAKDGENVPYDENVPGRRQCIPGGENDPGIR
jgi:hypothetical protein